MKTYPSIPGDGNSFHIPNAYIFDKLDGRNVRVEWNRKRGWHKWGTRHQLFDESNPDYAPAIPIFNSIYSEQITKIAMDNRWQEVTVFLELWQKNSLGGVFLPDEEFNLTLFDVSPYKQGLLGPKEFLKKFDHLPHAAFLGNYTWNKQLIESVRNNYLSGITFEGVIGKSGNKASDLIMVKAKTNKWLDAIKSRGHIPTYGLILAGEL